QVVALLVPDFSHLKEWARKAGIADTAPEELVRLAEVRRLLKNEIERLTGDLADFEKVRRFAPLPHHFTLERGELTRTLKIKRKIVAENYASEIQAMYGGRGE